MGSPRLGKLDINYLMNAGFNYAQRNASQLVGNGTSAYVLDRWLSFTGFDGQPASQTTYSREQVSYDEKSEFSIKTTGSYSPGETIANVQRIESIFARDFINKKASFLARHNNDGFTVIKVRLKYPAIKDDFSSALTLIHEQIFNVTTDSVNNDLKFEDIAMPANVANGIQVEIVYVSDQTAVITSFTSQPKLNIGTKVQEFSLFRDDVEAELKICQRYFEFGHISKNGQATNAARYIDATYTYHAIKRIFPVISLSNTNSQFYPTPGVSGTTQYLYCAALANGTGNHAYFHFDWEADCEL